MEGGIRTDALRYVAYPLAEAQGALAAEGLDVRVRFTVDPHRSVREIDTWAVLAVRVGADHRVDLVAGAMPSLPRERAES